MYKNRWPRSVHSQCESVFHSIRSIGSKKIDNPSGVRSFGTWNAYRRESHLLIEFMRMRGRDSILNAQYFQVDISDYLEERLACYVKNGRSRQSFETTLSALGKLEFAINTFIEIHMPDHPKLDTEKIRMHFYARSKKLLPKSSRKFENRSYDDPVGLIKSIDNGTHQLQACLQYESGMRTEGVGAPSNQLKNPLTEKCLRGIANDPVTGETVGVIASREKGGKETEHFVSLGTYRRVEEYIARYGKLESDYIEYLAAINKAAMETNQYSPGKASHGLKHNFAQERYAECVAHRMTHEKALQQTSLETSHFRMSETLGYTRGK